MTNLYEPVTEIGKAIAGALMFDDQVRLDIHDILEKWEPEHVAEKEKAEKWVDLQRAIKYGPGDIVKVWEDNKKLEAVKTWYNKLNESPTKPYANYEKLQELEKILEGEE